MDYIFASAITSTELLVVSISYDIVCQWFINIFNRMLAWPPNLQPRAGLGLRPLIPKFHEPAHLERGHKQYSFNLAEGMGLSDGECPERVWGSHNPLTGATRTTGPGTRADILDDNFGHWNWLKYCSMGALMPYLSNLSTELINCLYYTRKDPYSTIQGCRCRQEQSTRSPLRFFGINFKVGP